MHTFTKGAGKAQQIDYTVLVPPGITEIRFGKEEKIIWPPSAVEKELGTLQKQVLMAAKGQLLKDRPGITWENYWFWIENRNTYFLVKFVNQESEETTEYEFGIVDSTIRRY